MCMICDMDHEELEMFNESEEVKMAWQGMIASSKFSDRIKGWSSCVPMHQGSLKISADNVDVLSRCFVSWLLMCRLCGVKGGRGVPARGTFPMEYAHLLRGVGCKSNTGTGVFRPD